MAFTIEPVDRESTAPIYDQIATRIREQIEDGRLKPGVKLPASRELAKRLDIHRRTVMQAYDRLVEAGWLRSGVGQGTFVQEPEERERTVSRQQGPSGLLGSARGAFAWDAQIRRRRDSGSAMWRLLSETRPDPEWIRFTGATADPALFPTAEFREVVNEVLRDLGAHALDYGQPEGLLSLREALSERLLTRGVRASADQILIVNGSQQGLDLIARLLVSEGDSVFVEEPGYPNGFRLLAASGARLRPIPVDDHGLSVPSLAQGISEGAARFLYTMPMFQNPTGVTLAPERVGPLLDLAARARLPIVEDQFDGDLCYDGESPRPLKAEDRHEGVILLGSFSKILFPGLRLGWLVVPRPLLPALRELRQLVDLSSGLLVQHAMDRFCRRGLLDHHLDVVRAQNGNRLRCMLEALDREMPEGVRWTTPRGGLTLWLSLPAGSDSFEFLSLARSRGVDFTPGPLFFPSGGGHEYLRLSFTREPVERIEAGIRILGELVREHADRGSEGTGGRPFV